MGGYPVYAASGSDRYRRSHLYYTRLGSNQNHPCYKILKMNAILLNWVKLKKDRFVRSFHQRFRADSSKPPNLLIFRNTLFSRVIVEYEVRLIPFFTLRLA